MPRPCSTSPMHSVPVKEQLWHVDNGSGYEIGTSAISEIGGMVLTPTDKGNIFALDAADGKLLWYHKISIALVNPMEVWKTKEGKNYILASAMDGVVTLLEVPVQ